MAISIIMIGSAKLNLLQSMRLCKKIYETASDPVRHAMSCFSLDPSSPPCLYFIVVFYSAVFKSSLPCQHQLVVGARIKLDLLLRILIVSGGGTYLLYMSMSCLWLGLVLYEYGFVLTTDLLKW